MILPDLKFKDIQIESQKTVEIGIDIHGVQFDVFVMLESGGDWNAGAWHGQPSQTDSILLFHIRHADVRKGKCLCDGAKLQDMKSSKI